MFLFMSFNAFSEEKLEASGKVFIINQAGDFQKFPADITHDVDMKTFTVSVNGKTFSTDKYRIREKSGRKIVYLIFANHSSDLVDHHKKVVMKGTAVKANNGATYYGDIFVQNEDQSDRSDEEVFEALQKDHHGSFQYFGGFAFIKCDQQDSDL